MIEEAEKGKNELIFSEAVAFALFSMIPVYIVIVLHFISVVIITRQLQNFACPQVSKGNLGKSYH